MEMNRKRTRREVLGLLSIASLSQGAATPERPNILFIYTDDHSYRTISCVSGSVHVGEDAEHRQARQARCALRGGLQRGLVHAVARDDAHRTSSASASSP